MSGAMMRWVVFVFAGALLAAVTGPSPAIATTVISETGPASTSWLVGVDFVSGDEEVLAASWTSSRAYPHVSISAFIFSGGDFGGMAYLTTQIGPGTINSEPDRRKPF